MYVDDETKETLYGGDIEYSSNQLHKQARLLDYCDVLTRARVQ